MDDRKIAETPHDLLQALAGRVDDDLLAWCRELAAVGEDGRAVDLACAALAAGRAELPPPVRAALVAAARAARTGLDADAALRPAREEPDDTAHRFDAAPEVVGRLAAAVATLPDRQVTGCRLHVTARTTPAGTAPGPVPQPILLAGIADDDPRPADVLAYQLAIACARAGVPAAVEVVVEGTPLPGYQRAALRSARAIDGATGPALASPAPPADPPAPPEDAGTELPRSSLADRMAAWDSFDPPDPQAPPVDTASEGPEPVSESPTYDSMMSGDPVSTEPVITEPAPVRHSSAELPAAPPQPDADVGPAAEPDARQVPFGRASGPLSFDAVDDTPAGPDPVIDGVAAEPAPGTSDERPRWPATGSLVLPSLPRREPPDRSPAPPVTPRPVPRPTALRPMLPPAAGPSNGHRARPGPDVTGPPREAAVRPLRPTGPDTPALASLGDPFTDAGSDPTGPVRGPEPRAVDEPAIDAADPLGLGRLPLSPEERHREPEPDAWLSDWLTGEWAMPGSATEGERPDPAPEPAAPAPAAPAPVARPVPRPTPAVRPVPRPSRSSEDTSELRPGTVGRLNDDDRELLARLQAELGPAEPGPEARPRVTRRAGIAPNGRAPRPGPPDIAG